MTVPVNEPLLDGNEEKYLVECIRTGWISSEGPFVKQFEVAFARRVGRRFGIAVANGTAALDVAIEAAGIQPGDEVIVPSFCIISCVNQIVRTGAKPVLIDHDPLTWNMDINQIEEKITARTKAILAVHTYGLPVDMASLEEIAKRRGLVIIEDAAEMIGQNCDGRPCGSFGKLSTFSFYPNKHVTTGEGGMILTDSEELAGKCRRLRNLCFQPNERFVHKRLGWNFRMSNLQAAVGVAQLERLDEFVAKKRRMGRLYNDLLSEISGIQLPLLHTTYAENIFWVYGIVLDGFHHLDARQVMARLQQAEIGSRPFFCPMHLQPVLRGKGLFAGERYPVAEHLHRRGFYIPSGLALTAAQQTEVAAVLREILA